VQWFISGAPGTALGWGVYWVFAYRYGWPQKYAIAAAGLPAACVSFWVQKDLVFQNHDRGAGFLQFLKFVTIKGILFGSNLVWLAFLTVGLHVSANLLLFNFLKHGLHVNKMLAFIVGPALFTGMSYLSSTRIFRQKNNQNNPSHLCGTPLED
jgi:putative flippase GtrA